MKILGLDQSTSHTGWCLIEDGKIIETGTIELKGTGLCEKIIMMTHEIENLVIKHQPEHLCLEDIYYIPGRYEAFKALAFLRGSLLWLWWLKRLSYPFIINCAKARKELGIKGNAKKVEVVSELNKKLNLNLESEHIADSIVVGLVGYSYISQNKSLESEIKKTGRKKRGPKSKKST